MSFEFGRKSDFGLGRNLCEKKPALCEKHTSQCEKKDKLCVFEAPCKSECLM
jgi:hypothetical protein